jgi:hypothetical protein
MPVERHARASRGEPAGQPVQVGRRDGGLRRQQALRQQGAGQAGQDIARSGAGEP